MVVRKVLKIFVDVLKVFFKVLRALRKILEVLRKVSKIFVKVFKQLLLIITILTRIARFFNCFYATDLDCYSDLTGIEGFLIKISPFVFIF